VLALALTRKARNDSPGASKSTLLAAGDGWRVLDIVCTSGPRDRPYEERYGLASISLVLSGNFILRGKRGASLLSPGALLLGSPGRTYECSHEHGEGDRCLSFQFDPELFERVAIDGGARRAAFEHDRLPPLRALAPISARASAALSGADSFEEVGLDLAASVVRIASEESARPARASAHDRARVAHLLRQLESATMEPYTVAELARACGLSRYHFLRTFKSVTGITPHQWILRARLRDGAHRLVSTRRPITEIALDVGFDDLSNFIRSFRAEFGSSPSHYRSGVRSFSRD
jgi:AraC-like DNA-binding protein